jgi:hypothetical protein
MIHSVKQIEFARMLGVDRSYITKLKRENRLVIDQDGRVLVKASKARIKETADPNRDDVVNRWRDERGGQSPELNSVPPELPVDDSPEEHSYQRARAKKEHFLAERARLDYEREIGELVPIADMRLAVADVVTTFRQALEQLPYRTGPDLVGKDLDAIRAVLRQDIRAALTDMEREFSKRMNQEKGDS